MIEIQEKKRRKRRFFWRRDNWLTEVHPQAGGGKYPEESAIAKVASWECPECHSSGVGTATFCPNCLKKGKKVRVLEIRT